MVAAMAGPMPLSVVVRCGVALYCFRVSYDHLIFAVMVTFRGTFCSLIDLRNAGRVTSRLYARSSLRRLAGLGGWVPARQSRQVRSGMPAASAALLRV